MDIKYLIRLLREYDVLFTEASDIQDIAAYCLFKYPELSLRELCLKLGDYVDPVKFSFAYCAVKRYCKDPSKYAADEIFSYLTKLDKDSQIKPRSVAHHIENHTHISEILKHPHRASNLVSFSGGLVGLQSSRYAKLNEDYDDK